MQKGFTLIELLVVSLIIILITTVILFKQQGFNSSTLLRSLSYSVALSMRQAQVYGVSVRESQTGSGIFAPGYGVYFCTDAVGTNPPYCSSHYNLFADANGDGARTAGEDLPTFTIGNGKGGDYVITKFCAHPNSGSDVCSGAGISSLNVYFRRPSPDACFSTSAQPGACAVGATPFYSYAYVQLATTGGTDVRTIKVTNTGQIAVCKLNQISETEVSTC